MQKFNLLFFLLKYFNIIFNKIINDDTENLHWFLQVISTQTVAFVKNTDKEDKEKAIKKSWEEAEPGRSEKAKIARRKFEI